jgi:hypothetical protein
LLALWPTRSRSDREEASPPASRSTWQIAQFSHNAAQRNDRRPRAGTPPRRHIDHRPVVSAKRGAAQPRILIRVINIRQTICRSPIATRPGWLKGGFRSPPLRVAFRNRRAGRVDVAAVDVLIGDEIRE